MRLDHPIFHDPLPVDIVTEDIDTPANYRTWFDGRDLPAKLPAWQVQTRDFPEIDVGLVSDPFGLEDYPDAEWISSGVNSKSPNSVALARHGNFFFWGFFADPTDLTDSARRVFVNSVCYIAGFDGERPLGGRHGSSRDWARVYAGYLQQMPDQEFVQGLFPAALWAEIGKDGDAMMRYYDKNLEYLRPATAGNGFEVDPVLKARGVSNRKPAFLDFVAAALTADPADAEALGLVRRYGLWDLYEASLGPRGKVLTDLTSTAGFLAWLGANRPALFFADLAGFRWMINPKALPAEQG